VATDKEIEDIIAKTITSLHAGNAAIEIKKPKTLKDWTYVVLAVGGVLGFMFTSVVFLNDIADHAKDAHHEGSAELFEKIEHNIF
jgi:4-hydroxybenzoate polyprenyltransferase